MTQEEKQLLLKDLCARLLYGIKAKYGDNIVSISKIEEDGTIFWFLDSHNYGYTHCSNIKPYLRPMFSMTEEEKEEYFNVCDEDIKTLSVAMDAPDIIISDRGRTQGYVACKELEWLYEHHFDFIRKVRDEYKTLTDLGLAIEAPENMYNN